MEIEIVDEEEIYDREYDDVLDQPSWIGFNS
jgi:hypothetical protein